MEIVDLIDVMLSLMAALEIDIAHESVISVVVCVPYMMKD